MNACDVDPHGNLASAFFFSVLAICVTVLILKR